MKIQRVHPGWDYEIDVDDDAVCIVVPARDALILADATHQNATLTEDELAHAEDMGRQIRSALEES